MTVAADRPSSGRRPRSFRSRRIIDGQPGHAHRPVSERIAEL